ncbi:hypothetical protein E4U40_007937, partial [Claviceps sp. LM458 group G5]
TLNTLTEGETPDIRPSQEFGGSSRRGPGFGPENEDDEYEPGDVALADLLAKQSDLSALRDRVGDGLPPNATPDLPQPSILSGHIFRYEDVL